MMRNATYILPGIRRALRWREVGRISERCPPRWTEVDIVGTPHRAVRSGFDLGMVLFPAG